MDLDLEEALARAVVVELPLTVKFRGVTTREAVLVEGECGWGEFAPFPEYDDAEALAWWRSCLEAARCGFPEPLRSRVPVNATVPALEAGAVPELLDRYGDGITAVKVKVAETGQDLDQDLARVAAVRDHWPEVAIRVDANQGWDHRQAVRALSALTEYHLEYAEQPVAGVDGLYALKEELARRGVEVPIAADESVRKAEDPLAVARAGAADLIVVKVAPLGGVHRALDLVRQAGLPAVVSSALDTSVGLSAGVALAASLPELPHACGLGTGSLMARDVVAGGLKPRDGWLPVGAVAPDPRHLPAVEVHGRRRQWWLERIRRVHRLGRVGENVWQSPRPS